MMVLDPLISVLIIGILSSTIAQEQIPSQQILIEAPQVQRFVQYLENRIRRKCEKNGGPTAYEESNYRDNEQKFANCGQSLVNITQFEAEMTAARSHGEQDIVIQNYCRRIPTFKNCLKNVTNSIKLCLDPKERESVDILYKITSFMLQFSCDNRDAVEYLIAADGISCLTSKFPIMQTRCYNRIFTLANFDDVVLIPGLGLRPELSLDLDGCTQLQEYQRCSIGVLGECENSITANVVDDIFNSVKKEISCEILLNPQATNSEEKTLSSIRRGTKSFKKRQRRSSLLDGFTGLTSKLGDTAKSLSDHLIASSDVIKSVVEGAVKSVSDAVIKTPNTIKSVVGGAVKSVSDTVIASPDNVKSVVEGAVKSISDTIMASPDLLKSVIEGAKKIDFAPTNASPAAVFNVLSAIPAAIFMSLRFV